MNILDNINIMLHWNHEIRNEYYEYIHKNNYGIEVVAFSHYSAWMDNVKKLVKIYRSELKDFSNFISFYGPITDIIPHSHEPVVSDFSGNRIRQSIDIALELNASRIVFHSGINTIITDPDYINETIESQSKFWSDIAGAYPQIDCVIENMWEQNTEYLYKIIQNVNMSNFNFCFDIGHANVYGKISVTEWLIILNLFLNWIFWIKLKRVS